MICMQYDLDCRTPSFRNSKFEPRLRDPARTMHSRENVTMTPSDYRLHLLRRLFRNVSRDLSYQRELNFLEHPREEFGLQSKIRLRQRASCESM
jgi:hypothetical protein